MTQIQESSVVSLMSHEPTAGQREAIKVFVEYMSERDPYSVFLLRGYAGTGKSTLIKAFASVSKRVGLEPVLLATTGRAAKVLTTLSGRRATTVHRAIYRPSSALVEEGGHFSLDKLGKPSLIIVDEASMISDKSKEDTPFGSGHLLRDLFRYVQSSERTKLILVGDTAQLPPVGSELSEAIDPDVLSSNYGLKVFTYELNEVLRQAEGSETLRQATALREQLAIEHDFSTQSRYTIQLDPKRGTDLEPVDWDELPEAVGYAYRHYGEEQSLILSYSNKGALMHNLGIRTYILGYEEELVRGERLIVARNNYYYAQRKDKGDFIANGEMLEVLKIYRYHEAFGLRFADVLVRLCDGGEEFDVRILLSTLTDGKVQRDVEERQVFYKHLKEYYRDMGFKSNREMRSVIAKDPFWGALEVKYGYAVTVHKAQGGQWDCVLVDLSVMDYSPHNRNMLRWLYTAITRGKEKVFLVTPPKRGTLEARSIDKDHQPI